MIEKIYFFNEINVSKISDYDLIKFNNTVLKGKIGEPSLPYYPISLLLPPGHIAESIEIILEEKVDLPDNFVIYPKQSSKLSSEDLADDLVKNDDIYNSTDVYPQNSIDEITTEFINGYSIATSAFTPVKYYPSSGKLSYFKKITIRIKTEETSTAVCALQNLDSSANAIYKIENISQNPEILPQYQKLKYDKDAYQMLINNHN
ncbi:MAG: hypothetical protein JEY97_12490 [Bacteroidales bacterium]|nr:hypothetical protein [Bacteroidales bacterium]